MASTTHFTFGFYSAIQRRDVHMGGLLVLDYLGLPVSFHHTSPIKPGGISRLLMGHKDAAYYRSRVLLPPLLEALKAPPNLLLLNDKVTFEALDSGFSPPFILLAEGQGDPLPSPGDQETLEDGGLKVQLSDVGPPALLHGENLAQHLEALMAGSRHQDLLEPFHRVDQALQTLYDQEVREA